RRTAKICLASRRHPVLDYWTKNSGGPLVKLWLVPVYALVGFLLVVSIMPKTSWALGNQLNALLHLHSEQSLDWFDPASTSYPMGPAASENVADDDAKFLQLMDTTRHQLTDIGNQAQLRASKLAGLFAYCQSKNSAEYWAQYVRVSYGESRVP